MSQKNPVDHEEHEFLKGYDASHFERPSVAVDVAILSAFSRGLYAVVVQRDEHPDKGRWALPGGFVDLEESLDDAAGGVLRRKAGLAGVFLEQLYTFGAPRRDPRTRVISVAYYALVNHERLESLSRPAERVKLGRVVVPWEGEAGGNVRVEDETGTDLALAFDHAEILGMAVKRLRGKLDYAPIGFQLLPKRFTLRQLQDVHEVILGRQLNKDSFRRRMLAAGLLEATGDYESDVGHRPAERYRFVKPSAV